MRASAMAERSNRDDAGVTLPVRARLAEGPHVRAAILITHPSRLERGGRDARLIERVP